MQTLKQRQQLARWRDRSFVYHPSESHNDASAFRTRMRAYGKPELAEAPVRVIGQRRKA